MTLHIVSLDIQVPFTSKCLLQKQWNIFGIIFFINSLKKIICTEKSQHNSQILSKLKGTKRENAEKFY